MNYCLILVIFGSVGVVKSTHEIYNGGYNDGYMDGIEDCVSNTTHHITYILNEMESLRDLIDGRSNDAERVLTAITIIVSIILAYLISVTLFMLCKKIAKDMKEEERRQENWIL